MTETRRERRFVQRRVFRREARARATVAAKARTLALVRKAAPAKTPAGKPIKPVPTETAVALRFVRPDRVAVPGLEVRVEILDAAGNELSEERRTLGANGTTLVKLKKLPAIVRSTVIRDGWSIAESETDHLAVGRLDGVSEGKVGGVLRRRHRPAPVVVEREVADLVLTGTPGTKIQLGENALGEIAPNGRLALTMDADRFAGGATLISTREMPGRTFGAETAVASLDPYRTSTVALGAERLEAISDVRIADRPLDEDGLPLADSLEKAFGKANKAKIPAAPRAPKGERPMQETAARWTFGKSGVEAMVRPIRIAERKNVGVAERLRVSTPAAASIAGVRVGSSRAEVVAALGEGDAVSVEETMADIRGGFGAPPGDGLAYVQDGVRFYFKDDRVAAIDLLRPDGSLRKGIETRPPGEPVTIALGTFEAPPTAPNRTASVIRSWLMANPGLRLVKDEKEADFVLDFRIDSFSASRGQTLGIDSSLTIQNQAEYRWRSLEQPDPRYRAVLGKARVNYAKDIQGGGVIGLLAGAILGKEVGGNDTGTAGGAVAGAAAGTAVAKQKVDAQLKRAGPRLEDLALRTIVRDALARLAELDGFDARVIEIDRATGRLTVDAGSRQGIEPGTEFSLANIGFDAYDDKNEEFKEDRVVLRISRSEADSSVGTLVRVKRELRDNAFRVAKEEPVPWLNFALVTPRTRGVLATRIFRLESSE